MKFNYTNIDIKPINYYTNHILPDHKLSGNVYIDNKEWFNSFMPPYLISGENSLIFSKSNILFTMILIKKQIYNYFKLDQKITSLVTNNLDLERKIAIAHLGVNVSHKFFLPIEGLVTRKDKKDNPIKQTISESEQLKIALQIFNLDSVILPLAIIFKSKLTRSKHYKIATLKVCDLMQCTTSELETTLKILNDKFECSKHMGLNLATDIVTSNVQRIKKTNYFNEIEESAQLIHELIGIITWSKYFPTQGQTKYIPRNYTWTDIVFDIDKDFSPSGSSGSEKHGRLIWYLNNYFKHNEKSKQKVLKYSADFANKIFNTNAREKNLQHYKSPTNFIDIINSSA